MPRMSGSLPHRTAISAAWADYGDPRAIVTDDEVSANVSTNRVYRLYLDDGSTVVGKVSSYGSYFLFYEDHDQLNRCARLLEGTRFSGMLAEVWRRDDGRIFTWYDQRMWVVFYDDVPRREQLPRVLSVDQVRNLGREIAEFHLACTDLAPKIPAGSKTVKSDAIHLLDLLESPFAPRNFDIPPEFDQMALLASPWCVIGMALGLVSARIDRQVWSLIGLSELRQRALKSKTPFPSAEPAAGLRVLDRYRFEVVLARSCESAERTGKPLALLVVDADHFKRGMMHLPGNENHGRDPAVHRK